MEQRLKQRLVGAIVLVSLAVVFVPILFDSPRELNEDYPAAPVAEIPERPQVEADAPARITIEAPETPRLDAEVERGRQASNADAADRRASTEAPASSSSLEASAPASGASGQPASARRSDASSARSEPATARPDTTSGKKQTAGAPAAAGGSSAAASNGWVVQLGSFRMAENARALHRRLQARGYPVLVEPGPSAQGEVFRVFVGPMSRRKQAEDSAAKLRREMALQGIVVSRSGG